MIHLAPMRVGVVGCGSISDIYLRNAPLFPSFKIAGVADIRPEASAAKAAQYGIDSMTVQAMMTRDDIDAILNLTIPEAHAPIALQAIAAGKHVYLEKPLATSLADARAILDAAAEAGVRIGSAPDTVLGPGVSTARELIISGRIGRPLIGTSAMMNHGMEARHPSPDFFFKPGGGPVLDMGPYYVALMTALLGGVTAVEASGLIGFAERIITTPGAARQGETIRVETFTTVQGMLYFECGAQVSFSYSWDIWKHSLPPLELHGTEASLRIPDPNFFAGKIEIGVGRDPWEEIDTSAMPYGEPNYPYPGMAGFPDDVKPLFANYRGLGLADLATSIAADKPHRASGEVALHVLEVLTAIMEAATHRRRINIMSKLDMAIPTSATPALSG